MAAVVPLIALLFAIILVVSCYRYGMFFDVLFYCWEGIVIAGAAAIWLYYESLLRLSEGRGADKPRRTTGGAISGIGRGSMPIAAAGPLLLAVLYGVSLLHEPVSMLGTIDQILRWSAYAAFFAAACCWFERREHRIWLECALQAAGAFMAGGALAGWLGWISFPEIVMTTSDQRLSAVGARLAGFMQSPNFLGAVAGAYLVWQLALLVRSRSRTAVVVSASMAVPFTLVLLLTESRGAWLASAAGWAAGTALMKRDDRAGWLLYSGCTLAAAGAAYRLVYGAGLRAGAAETGVVQAEPAVAAGLLSIVAASAAGLAGIRYITSRGVGMKAAPAWGVLLAGAAVLAALLPSSVHGRLGAGHFETAGARELFYKDALKLFWEAPLLGRGGDAWRSLFAQIQSHPYVGNEVHCGYLEILLDLGTVGLLAFCAVLAVLLRKVWMRDPTGLLPVSVLLLHAAVDFDMSYGFFWLLLFAWIALYGGGGGSWELHGTETALKGRMAGEEIGSTAQVRMTGEEIGSTAQVRMTGEETGSTAQVRIAEGVAGKGAHVRRTDETVESEKQLLMDVIIAGNSVQMRGVDDAAEGAVAGSMPSGKHVAAEPQGSIPPGHSASSQEVRFPMRWGEGRSSRSPSGLRWLRALMASALVALAVVVLTAAAVCGWRFDRAVQHREAAAAASGAAREAALRAALEANPYWTRIRLELAQLAPPPERAALLAAGLRYEPQSVPLHWALGGVYAERGDTAQAAAHMRLALRCDRYNRAHQTGAVTAFTQLAQELRAAGRRLDAVKAAQQALAFYREYAALERGLAVNDRKFAVTAEAERAAAESRQLLAEIAEARFTAYAPFHPPAQSGADRR